jgi:quercetin 2,3-dioxygenase
VGPHPHRGFETVTLAFEGSVAHHDSAGNSGVIGPGDVQWMTAASGILHREYHEEGFARAGGAMHMMQLWVNLPRRHKMDPPRYQGITAGDIPAIALPGGGTLHLVAGNHGGVTGPAKTFSPVHLSHARLPAGAALELAFPAAHNAAILVMSGEIAVAGQAARALDLVSFANDGEVLRATATSEAHVLVLGGEPLDEPVVQYGPFVMSTEAEIRQAILDFQAGRFGELPA